MKTFDKLVPREYNNYIESVFMSENFPWFLTTKTVTYMDKSCVFNNNVYDIPQFVHLFYRNDSINSEYYKLVTPFISELEKQTGKTYLDRLIRIKANLMYKRQDYPIDSYCSPHCDCSDNVGRPVETESLIYYVNDTDGDTLIFNEVFDGNHINQLTIAERITPNRGHSVLFNSTALHTGTPPRSHDFRIVINFVFFKDKQ